MSSTAIAIAAFGCIGCAPSLAMKSAGHVGCLPSEVHVRDASREVGLSQTVTTWVARCKGKSHVCTEVKTSGEESESSQVHCRERASQVSANPANRAGQPEKASAEGPPPRGAAGFELGDSRINARSICESAGHTWEEGTSTGASCSGAPQSLGFNAKVLLEFCSERTCALAIIHRPETGWMKSWVSLYRALSSKYGESLVQEVTIPDYCLSEASFAECVARGEATGSHRWKWQSGERVHYGLLKGPRPGDDQEGPAIQIVYQLPNEPRVLKENKDVPMNFEANPAAL